MLAVYICCCIVFASVYFLRFTRPLRLIGSSGISSPRITSANKGTDTVCLRYDSDNQCMVYGPPSPTPDPEFRQQQERYRKLFEANLYPFTPVDSVYTGWRTYTNRAHGYTLRYPPGWTLDSSMADRVNDWDRGCCENAVLTLRHNSTTWRISVGIIYTGGGGMAPESFPDFCQPLDNTPCIFTYSGPFSLGKIASEQIYKRSIVYPPTHKTLSVEIGHRSGQAYSVSPYFAVGPYSDMPDETQLGSIDYLGTNLDADMQDLDKITASLRFF